MQLQLQPTLTHAIDQSIKAQSLQKTAAILAVVAILSGCGTTPLPPWPGNTAAKPVVPAPIPGKVLPPSSTSSSGAVVTPLPPTAGQGLSAKPTPELPPQAAVSARFAEPAITYETPGLALQRKAFTTNTELTTWLRSIAQAPLPNTLSSMVAAGTSQQGSTVWAMVFSRASSATPAALEATGKPTVLLIGQQHGDEPAGAEALLVLARELGQGLLEPLLDRINVVIVPRANPDGAAIDARLTSNGIDLNSDHLTLDTPEAQALAKLVRTYRPMVVVDAHEYPAVDPALRPWNVVPKYDAMVQYSTTPNYPEFLAKASQEWIYQPLVQALQSQKLTSEWYHSPASEPSGGLRMTMGSTAPDNGRNVHGLKNTISLLIETRGVGLDRSHIQRRVHTHVTAITSVLRSTAERAPSLEQVRTFVSKDISAQACRDFFTLQARPTTSTRDLIFLDANTGVDRILPVQWESATALQATQTRARPCGYWLAPSASNAAERLRQLGLQVLRIGEAGAMLAEAYYPAAASQAALAQNSAQAINPTRLAIDAAPGSFYVPLNQPLAYLAIAALEPDTPFSYLRHGLVPQMGDVMRVVSPPSLVFEETD